jgi:putative endonuclease
MHNMARSYYIYILASRSRNLYTGVTNNIDRRLIEHREGLVPGFTTCYRIFRLVHFEAFANVRAAIAREKEIKGWRRERKVWLIKRHNPHWQDLAQWQIELRRQMQVQLQKQDELRRATSKEESTDKADSRSTADPSPPFVKGRRPGSG